MTTLSNLRQMENDMTIFASDIKQLKVTIASQEKLVAAIEVVQVYAGHIHTDSEVFDKLDATLLAAEQYLKYLRAAHDNALSDIDYQDRETVA